MDWQSILRTDWQSVLQACTMNEDREYYTRNLPHRQPKDGVFDLVLRLKGSLPKEVILQLKQLHQLKKQQLKELGLSSKNLAKALREEQELYYGKFDHLLDNADSGPTYLAQPEVAQIVYNSFLHWHKQQRYKLVCLTIMSNHVHLILYKIQKPLFRILQSIKTYTATEANLLLNRTGQAFWNAETYDHLIKSRQELATRVQYNLNNPVVIGRCAHWSEWEFSWLNPEFETYAPPPVEL